MKKFVSTLLVCSFIAGIAAASGGCSSQKAKPSANAPTTLSVMWWAGNSTRNTETEKVEQMYTAKHPNVKFQSTPLGWDGYEAKLTTMAAGGTLPDVEQMDYSFMDTFTNNNSLADLTSYVKNKTIDMSDVDPTLESTGEIGGKLTGIVISIGTPAIVYDPAIFKKAGLSMPTNNWTWNDLINDCMTIHKKLGIYGEIELWTTDGNTQANFDEYLRQYGLQLYSKDGKSLGYTDDSYFINFANTVKELTDAGAAPTPDQEVQIQAKSKDQWPSATGGAAMIFDELNYPIVAASTNANLQDVVYPSNVSSGKPNYLKPGMLFSISQTSKNKDQAADFINYFINNEDANKVIDAERGVPVSSSIRNDLTPTLTQQQKVMFNYVDTVQKDSSKVDPPNPSGASEVSDDLTNVISSVLYNKETPQQAAAQFRQEANSALSQAS